MKLKYYIIKRRKSCVPVSYLIVNPSAVDEKSDLKYMVTSLLLVNIG